MCVCVCVCLWGELLRQWPWECCDVKSIEMYIQDLQCGTPGCCFTTCSGKSCVCVCMRACVCLWGELLRQWPWGCCDVTSIEMYKIYSVGLLGVVSLPVVGSRVCVCVCVCVCGRKRRKIEC